MAPEPRPLDQREPIGIAAWTAAAVGLGTALFLAASMAGLYLLYRPEMGAVAPPRAARFPEPRIQSDPTGDLLDLQAEQRRQAQGYAWVDRERGLARIPVARAVESLAARGQAAYDPLQAPEPGLPLPVRSLAARRAEAGR
ncbi:hypothetical protein EAH89_17815 [Roseomonas nepalensis]|uniref:Uncharacterized protein n=1 Tax=Muricoccus nepalensis TaxID=1854500 RepID=A0A502FUU9_9PROT|nr:hypothetical protein [Roseomonas nepalensis]TPG53169.1 hypothetical protein EAH89_17815 [Roseomonas nepalensis]